MAGTVAIDVGGTFTDITYADAVTGESWVAKTPSTPADLATGFIAAVRKAWPGGATVGYLRVLMGTTDGDQRHLRARRRRPRW